MAAQVHSLAFRPLVLRALKQLSDTERKELCVLYSLSGELNEAHQILSALAEGNKLSISKECLELFITNLEAIDSQKETVREIIEAAKQMKDGFEPPTRQESLPFPTPSIPKRDGDPIALAGAGEPVQEENQQGVHRSQMVAGNKSLPPTITLDAIAEVTRQNKRPRLDSSTFGPTPQLQPCDSTYNSEASEAEDDGEESDDQSDNDDEALPKAAMGDDLKFIQQAREVAMRSEDPHTKVGAVVVNKEGKVIGEGHNYLPKEGLPWDRDAENEADNKYLYVTHAAVTAIQNAYKAKEDPKGATLYTTLFPSARDGVFILTSEIAEVVFLEKSREWRKRYHTGATKRLFEGDIPCRQVFIPETRDSLD